MSTAAEPSAPERGPDHVALARLLRLAGHPVRLEILTTLLDGVRCVKDINELFEISQPNLSQHMSALRKAGLLASEKNGALRCYYVIRPDLVRQLLALQPDRHEPLIRSRAEVLAELEDDSDG